MAMRYHCNSSLYFGSVVSVVVTNSWTSQSVPWCSMIGPTLNLLFTLCCNDVSTNLFTCSVVNSFGGFGTLHCRVNSSDIRCTSFNGFFNISSLLVYTRQRPLLFCSARILYAIHNRNAWSNVNDFSRFIKECDTSIGCRYVHTIAGSLFSNGNHVFSVIHIRGSFCSHGVFCGLLRNFKAFRPSLNFGLPFFRFALAISNPFSKSYRTTL